MTVGRLGIWIVNAALFTLCCFLAAGLIDSWIAERMSTGPAAAPPPVTASAATARAWSDRQIILDRNLFQVSTLLPPKAADTAPAVTEEELEATRLPLKLLGTAAAKDQKKSYAAVEDQQSHKQIVVRVDDRLLDKATVIRIERRRIVLQNGAKREELALDEEEAPGAGARRPAALGRAPGAPPQPVGQDLRERVKRLSEDTFQVQRDEVEAAARNPAELFSNARLLPIYGPEGTMTGVQVSSIKPGSLFEQIGIHDGDTVVQVNGMAITSPQDSAALLKELSSASEFQVQVLSADGQFRSLNYSIGE